MSMQIISQTDNEIRYSRGSNKYDNAPEQRAAATFDDFEVAVLADLSQHKGMAFICAPLASGLHYERPDKYPGRNHWRLKDHAEPRAFLSFDFDGFSSPEMFAATWQFLASYRGFGYTTASHTAEAPRARAILQASRPVTRDEGIAVCQALQAQILDHLGANAIQFDDSVYRGEQPVYTPVTTSEVFHFGGAAVDVDALLIANRPASTHVATPGSTVAALGTDNSFHWPDKIEDGSGREDFIIRAAGHLRGTGATQATIERMLLDYNQLHIVPPLDDAAVLDRTRRYVTPDPIHAANDSDWPQPEELNTGLPPVPPFDDRLLPPVFRAWVKDIAERMQCPIEFLAVGAMIAAGSVVGNRIGVQPKRLDTGWIEVPNLWGAVVGRPGVMKSPALAQVLLPLRRLEADALAGFATTRAQFEIDRMHYDATRKHIEAQIKKGATIPPGQLPVSPEEPKPPRYLINDSTYQKLGDVLCANPHGLMVFQDEMSGLLMRLDTAGQESSRAFYLEAWNGQQSYTFDRMERGTVRIPRLCFSMLGGLQPSKLREYLRSAVYGGKGDDGLAQRLQMIVYPDIDRTWTHVDRRPDLAAIAAADAVFDSLNTLDPLALGARMPFLDGTPVFSFDDAAQDLFNSWWSDLENNLRSSDNHPALESHISKYRKLVPALALLNHLLVGKPGDITAKSVGRAIFWQRFLLAHAQRAYVAVTSATMDSAQALSRHIQRGALHDGFTVREVYRHNWSLLSNVKEAAEAVEVLTDLGWLRAVQDVRVNATDGRPTVRYYINPRLKAAA